MAKSINLNSENLIQEVRPVFHRYVAVGPEKLHTRKLR